MLFAPLPIPARPGGTDSTAILPRAALTMPLPRPVMNSPGTNRVQPRAGAETGERELTDGSQRQPDEKPRLRP